MKKKPKILLWDIETLYNVSATWGIFDQNIPHTGILKERSIICISYKWLGDNQIHTISIGDRQTKFKKDPHDDSYVLRKFHKVLSTADYSIYHNGDKFDQKYFNTRSIALGLPPIPKKDSVDTLKVAKKYFAFNSNRLDYIARFLGVGQKLKTSDCLWLGVLNKDLDSVKQMGVYCEMDVQVLEAVYLKLRPWIEGHPNHNVYIEGEEGCPACGSKHLVGNGIRATKTATYQRLTCKECGSHSRRRTALRTVDIR